MCDVSFPGLARGHEVTRIEAKWKDFVETRRTRAETIRNILLGLIGFVSTLLYLHGFTSRIALFFAFAVVLTIPAHPLVVAGSPTLLEPAVEAACGGKGSPPWLTACRARVSASLCQLPMLRDRAPNIAFERVFATVLQDVPRHHAGW